MKITQVCKEEECDKKSTDVKIGSVYYIFCCQKGFEQSLKAFEEFVGKSKKTDNN